MNPHTPVAADGVVAARVGDFLPRIARGAPPERTSCTYFFGGPQRLIDLPGLLGLIDVTRSPGGSGHVFPIAGTKRPGQAFHKKATRGFQGLIEVAHSPDRSGSVIPIASIHRASLIQYPSAALVGRLPVGAQNQRQQLPPPSWSLKQYYGDPLFEIFAVYANFPLAGQVLLSGGMATKIICQLKFSKKKFNSQRAEWATKHPQSKLRDFRIKLPPTGPSNYFSAYSGVVLGVRMDSTKSTDEEEPIVLLDWQDSPMSVQCNTATITTSKGVVEVLCALINEAVEVGLCLRLCIPSKLCSSRISGSITARTDIFDPWITIFTRDAKSSIKLLKCAGHPVPNFLPAKSYRHVTLPLVRASLAVPIRARCIEFEGCLKIGKSTTMSLNQSILLNAEDITSKWVSHGDCYTTISMCVRRAP